MAIRTLFIGTGEFAVPVLEALLDAEVVEVVGVVTQPDKPAGRAQELLAGPVGKALDGSLKSKVESIKIFKPEKLRSEAEQILEETRPELIIVAAYGQMIPDIMLDYPKYRALNLHGSLLPQLRGAVPVPMAIMQGLSRTGVTIQRMVKELDAGPVIAQVATELTGGESAGMLMSKLAHLGADLLIEILPKWIAGDLPEQPQQDDKATYCYQQDISKDKAQLMFHTPAALAERMIRAFNPWPVAWVELDSAKRLKVFSAKLHDEECCFTEGMLVRKGKALYLQLRDGLIELGEIQLEGKQKRDASEYLFLDGVKIA